MLFQQLRQDGERLFVEPDARMVHAHEHHWRGFLTGSFHSARLGAASVVEARQLGVFERLLQTARHLLGAVRWPMVLWLRTRSLPRSEQWLPVFYRNLLFVFQYYGIHAVGGALGIIAGRGDSDQAFLVYELNEGRQEPTMHARAPYGNERK
jgi:hypothetical protein